MNEIVYIESAQSKIDRYNRICQIIDKLEIQLLNVNSETYTQEYYILDDGQSKITSAYRNPEEIMKALKSLEFMKKRLLNELNGNVMIMRNAIVLKR